MRIAIFFSILLSYLCLFVFTEKAELALANKTSPSANLFITPNNFDDVALVSQNDTPSYAVAVEGDYAYVATADSLEIYDISDPHSPERINESNDWADIRGLAIVDNYAYLAHNYLDDNAGGLRIIDITNKVAPFEVSTYSTEDMFARDVIVVGGLAYLANIKDPRVSGGSLQIINIANPYSPHLVGSYGSSSTLSVTVEGSYAYIASGLYTSANQPINFEIINVANPASPFRVSFYGSAGDAWNVAISGNYAYVAEHQDCVSGICDPNGGGLRVLNISNPSNPYQVDYYSGGLEAANDVKIENNYAYVIDSYAGLRVFNITNPASIYEIGFYETGYPLDLATDGIYAYIADYHDGFTIVCFAGINQTTTDSGFRSCPDGYHFKNPHGINFNDYTMADMREMFGDSAVCVNPTVGGMPCIYKPTAMLWRVNVNLRLWGGRCLGMAATSSRFFYGIGEPPESLQPGAYFTYDLLLENARRHVTYFSVEQFALPILDYRHNQHDIPSVTLAKIQDAIVDREPVVLVLKDGLSSHAITPYKVENEGGGIWWVWSYDNEDPSGSVYVAINTVNETWYYSGLGWTGDQDDFSLYTIPVSLFDEPQICPVCGSSGENKSFGGVNTAQVWLNGSGHLLVTNEQGGRIGFIGEQFINEIPGAFETISLLSPEAEAEPIYTIPITDTYDILLDGQTLT